jgi:retron-type reverse transcriptase
VAGSVPTVKDRIVQTAVKFVLEPIFEATFCPTSYGFRPGLGCRDALREVAQLIKEGPHLRGGWSGRGRRQLNFVAWWNL